MQIQTCQALERCVQEGVKYACLSQKAKKEDGGGEFHLYYGLLVDAIEKEIQDRVDFELRLLKQESFTK